MGSSSVSGTADPNEALYRDKSFLGHPKGLFTVCVKNLCSSFAYYGFTAVLIYYLYTEVSKGGLGLEKTEAAQLLSLYFALIVVCGVVGSYMSDRVFGVRKSLRIVVTIGPLPYIILAIPGSGLIGYAAAMGIHLIGSMVAGQAMTALTGKLYAKGDERRDGAFSYVYVISNIGAAIPSISGTVALMFGYHAAFALSAAAAIVGSAFYLIMERRVFGTIGEEPDDPMPPAARKRAVYILIAAVVITAVTLYLLFSSGILTITRFANSVSSVALFLPVVYFIYVITSPKTKPDEKRHILFLLPMFIAYCFTLLISYQGQTILSIYAETSVDLNLFGVQITPAAFQTLQAVCSVILGTLMATLWAALGKKQPSTPAKMGIGTICYGLAILIMIAPFQIYAPDDKASPLWLVGFYVVMTVGEAICYPAGTSAATAVAPLAFSTQMMTIWFMGQSTGASLCALVANFYKEGAEIPYFVSMGIPVVAVGLLVLLFSRRLAKGMGLGAETASE